MSACGLVIAAPASGSGKTLLTLALLRALKNRGLAVAGAKSGPDYIDPKFHEAACGHASVNLDAWAMPAGQLTHLAAGQPGDLLIVEGAMGAMDGAGPEGSGSVADLAVMLGLPVILVLDVARQGHSAALPVAGLLSLRPDLAVAGVILNRIGSPRHEVMARAALAEAGVPVLGAIARHASLAMPERHLGLVQAGEHADLEAFLENAAGVVGNSVDLDALIGAATPLSKPGSTKHLPPLGQRTAIACDNAFSFTYPHLLQGWRAQGAELSFFSPLADEIPAADCDAIFLPGGYPELHGETLSKASRFKAGIRIAAQSGKTVYGECGGYMVLGNSIVDARGRPHDMLGLLPVETSFADRKLNLGYRRFTPLGGAPWTSALLGHEFHYSTVVSETGADRLFEATDAFDEKLAPMGLRSGSVCGSFAHIIAPVSS
ncbi:MAG: cobyrinate a,c-diamide synthase [Pseudomonadota bacterium]